MKVIVNGKEASLQCEGLSKVSEVIELIKSMIDPDHMITVLMLNGKELEDKDWTASTAEYGTAIFEVETGTPASFVADRFGLASNIIRSCFMEFRDARKGFQAGKMQQGNHCLIQAVNTARAFFEWYSSLIDLVPQQERSRYDISPQVQEISTICKRICQQQLYQSWWALGETLEKELEPKLDKLEDFCRNFQPSASTL